VTVPGGDGRQVIVGVVEAVIARKPVAVVLDDLAPRHGDKESHREKERRLDAGKPSRIDFFGDGDRSFG
jgi:hypothetical protein